MSDIKFTPAYIVENYLPEYEERLQVWRYDPNFDTEGYSRTKASFIKAYFSVSVEFLLKAQRESCMDNYGSNISPDYFYNDIIDLILDADIPSPKKA